MVVWSEAKVLDRKFNLMYEQPIEVQHIYTLYKILVQYTLQYSGTLITKLSCIKIIIYLNILQKYVILNTGLQTC
jgi:hypothetical protein